MADNTAVPLNRIERVLAFMIATIAGLSVVAIVAIIVASLTRTNTSEGPWLAIAVLPSIGLPIAFVLVIVFAVLAIVRRRRLANGAD